MLRSRRLLRYGIGWLVVAAVLVAESTACAETLEYVEVLTGGARAEEALPMIVAVHGLGDRPESFRMFVVGLGAKARVIVPRGIDEYGDHGFSWFALRRGTEGGEGFADGVRKAARRLAELIHELRARHTTLGKPVITGFSQGGILSYTMAALYPESLGVAIPVSGFFPDELWPGPEEARKNANRDLPKILALHGDDDVVVAVEPARWSIAVLKDQGFDAELRRYPGVGHTITADMRRDLLQALTVAVEEAWMEYSGPGDGPPAARPSEYRRPRPELMAPPARLLVAMVARPPRRVRAQSGSRSPLRSRVAATIPSLAASQAEVLPSR